MKFGDFINKHRLENKMTLRELAKKLDISVGYLSDIEKDRRNPFELEKLEQLSNILNLSEKEKENMMYLAGLKREEVSPDLPEYIMDRQYVDKALRKAKNSGAGEREWKKFLEILEEKEGDDSV